MSTRSIFKVLFVNQGKVYELFARNVSQGELYGFVQVEELIFGERSAVVVDPSEEKLKDEFASVKRILIPMHAVIRVDEVEKVGTSKIRDGSDKVTPFPTPFYTPGAPKKGDG